MPPADCRDSERNISAYADPVEAFASESFREISHKYAKAYLKGSLENQYEGIICDQ